MSHRVTGTRVGAQCKLQPPALGPRSQGPPANGQQREDSWATLNQQGAATATCQCQPQAPGCLPHPTPGPMAQTLEGPPLSPTGTAADCQAPQGRLTLAHTGQHWRPPTLTSELRRRVLPSSPLRTPESTACHGVPGWPPACRGPSPQPADPTQHSTHSALTVYFSQRPPGGTLRGGPVQSPAAGFHRRSGPSRLGRSMSVSQSGAATRSSAPRLPEAAWALGQAVGLAWVPGTPVHKSWGWPTPEPRCRPRPPGLP